MQVGPGLQPGVTIGPLIDERAVDKVDEHVRDAVGRGARLTVGGERLTGGDYDGGAFYAPTVLADVTSEMLISHEETFGPVAGAGAVRHRGRGGRARERHGLRPGGVLPHARLRAPAARRREARVRHRRRQQRDHQLAERPVRRRQGVRATAARAAPSASTSTWTSSTSWSATSASGSSAAAACRGRSRSP